MVEKFICGGSEAPLTPFTVAQMNALKIYAVQKSKYPCRAGDLQKSKNSMVLGEGASIICIEKNSTHKPLAYIEGVGYATEPQTNGVGLV